VKVLPSPGLLTTSMRPRGADDLIHQGEPQARPFDVVHKSGLDPDELLEDAPLIAGWMPIP